MKKNTLRSQAGFSLLAMMVGVGILSALSLGFMELIRSSLMGQQKILEIRDLNNLINEMGILLDSENHCRNSLAGPGAYGTPTQPVTFKKQDIDGDGEGLDVELYASSQDGKTRIQKMFSAIESPLNQYGSFTIKSIKLLMNTGSPGSGYSENEGHEDIGVLRVRVQNLDKQEQSFEIKLSVWMKTSADGTSTLLSCSRSGNSQKCGTDQKWHSKCGCIPNRKRQEWLFFEQGPTEVPKKDGTGQILRMIPNPDLDKEAESYIGQWGPGQKKIKAKDFKFHPEICQYCKFGYSKSCKTCKAKCPRHRETGGNGIESGWIDNTCACFLKPDTK